MTRTVVLFDHRDAAGFDAVTALVQPLADRGLANFIVIGAPRALRLEEGRATVQFVPSLSDVQTDGRILAILPGYLVAPTALERLIDADSPETDVADVLALVDENAERVFDPETTLRLDVDGREVVMAGALIARAAFFQTADLFAVLRKAARRRQVALQDVAGAVWHRVTDEASRRHAEWLLRVYGSELDADTIGVDGAPRIATAQLVDALLDEKEFRRDVLMNPGPVMTSARVKSALVQPDMCHRDAEYAGMLRRLRRKLARVFRAGPEHSVLLLTGSGTAAMEASIATVVPRGRKLLVVSNGAFGERFVEIAETHFLEVEHLRYAWGEVVEPSDVERALAFDPSIFAVAVIHHETSVGLLNPVGAIGALCRRYDKLLICDTVSSLGAEDVDVIRDRIDVCFSSANKCLHGVAGVSFVCVNARVWARIADTPARSYYLDLRRYQEYAESKGLTPFTPAVATLFALEAAVDELLEKGLAHRQALYRRRNRTIRAGLRALGLSFLTATGQESSTITTVRLPEGVTYATLQREMKERGYIVYDCKPPLQDAYFQIANMGELSEDMVDSFLESMRDALGRARVRRPDLRLVSSTQA